MDEKWADRLSDRLSSSLGRREPLLTLRLQAELLRLARDVAHGSERKNAPLAAFLAGRYVELRCAAGASPDAALREVVQAASALLSGTTASS